jgi:hypothetical protein
MPEYMGDFVYRLRHTATFLGQRLINVYYYGTDEVSADAADLGGAFIDDVIPVWQDIVVGGTASVAVDVEGVKGTGELYHADITAGGTRVGEALPPYVAWAFRLNHAARTERNGYKRFGGVSETDVEFGVATSAMTSPLDAMAGQLSAGLPGDTPVFVPVIQRRYQDKVKLEVPTYWTFSDASYVSVSTQNSRKFGRGI